MLDYIDQDYLAFFTKMRVELTRALLATPPIHPTHWQKLDVSASPMHATYELRNVVLSFYGVGLAGSLEQAVPADLPWAEDHFRERVSGQPMNPGKAHAYWPYHGRSAALHQRDDEKRYDHNYMERFWPKNAGDRDRGEGWRQKAGPGRGMTSHGYRFPIGDLGDVVRLLRREPTTRQAFLPVWFPEDTGSTEGQRVPCTLGYHFIIRNGELHCSYFLRSCEIYRHFTNDVYLAVRLMQWVGNQVGVPCGELTMFITSLHGFVGDRTRIEGLATWNE